MPWMTIPIALAIGGGAGAASSIYATKRAGSLNEKALKAQREEGITAAQIEREKLAYQEHARQESLALDKERWADYVNANRPSWEAGQRIFGNLLDTAHVARGSSMPTFQMPSASAPPPTAASQAPWTPTTTGTTPVAGAPTSGALPSRGRQMASMAMPAAGNPMTQLMSLYDLARVARGVPRGTPFGQDMSEAVI